jgi:hypothetical protein
MLRLALQASFREALVSVNAFSAVLSIATSGILQEAPERKAGGRDYCFRAAVNFRM